MRPRSLMASAAGAAAATAAAAPPAPPRPRPRAHPHAPPRPLGGAQGRRRPWRPGQRAAVGRVTGVSPGESPGWRGARSARARQQRGGVHPAAHPAARHAPTPPHPPAVPVPGSSETASTQLPIPVPPVPELLDSVADPAPAPGRGPVRDAAAQEPDSGRGEGIEQVCWGGGAQCRRVAQGIVLGVFGGRGSKQACWGQGRGGQARACGAARGLGEGSRQVCGGVSA